MAESLQILSPEDFLNQIMRLHKAEEIAISRCHLVKIPKIILYLPQLTVLDLSSNPLRSIEDLWESNLPLLRELNLAACWLQNLPVGPPSFANTLQVLNLDGNFLGNAHLNFTLFPHLKTLSVVRNDLTEFPKTNPNLDKLVYRMNAFTTIPPYAISQIDACYCTIPSSLEILDSQITSLNLSHCGIFGDLNVPALPLLGSFDASDNSLTSITFESSRRLQELRLSFNGLTEFPEAFFHFPMLRVLDLSHNAITKITRDLSKLRRLETLDLAYNLLYAESLILPNKLSSIRMSFNFVVGFEAFPASLKHIDASFCQIAIFPPILSTIEWIAVYFVKQIIVSERIKAIEHDDKAESEKSMENALAPIDLFRSHRVVRTSSNSLNLPSIGIDKLTDYIGRAATSGRSTKYEDNYLSCQSHGVQFVGVFDGHAGARSAILCSDLFPPLLEKHVVPVFDDTPSEVKKAMRFSFALINDDLKKLHVHDGTTAVIIGLKNNRAVCAHVGDSLALLVRRDTDEWLTFPHKPTDKTEYDRMRFQSKSVSSDWRIDGKLCVSRSLGDFWCCDGMFDEPDVTVKEIPEDTMSIVLACDGLWDYIDSGVVCNVVRTLRNPVKAARLLQDYAFASGSHDSISVIVVNFPIRPSTKSNQNI